MKKVLLMIALFAIFLQTECAAKKKQIKTKEFLKTKVASYGTVACAYYLLGVSAFVKAVKDSIDSVSSDNSVISLTDMTKKFLTTVPLDIGFGAALIWAANRCTNYRDFYFDKLTGIIKLNKKMSPEVFEVEDDEKEVLMYKAVFASLIAISPLVASCNKLANIVDEYQYAQQHDLPFSFKDKAKFCVLAPILAPVVAGSLKKWGPYSLRLWRKLFS